MLYPGSTVVILKTDGKEPKLTIQGSLLFNIYVNGLFYILEQSHVCKCADDITLNACNKYLTELLLDLEHDSLLAGQWFGDLN